MLTPKPTKNILLTILAAWLLAGTLDITTALVMYTLRTGKNPLLVFNYISSAVFGKDAYTGGTPMIIAGFLFHYLVAFIFSVSFFLLYPRLYPLIKNKLILGLSWGLFTWCVMNLLVVPLTRIPSRPIQPANAIENIVILMLAIGLPVALLAHHFYYGKSKQ